MHFCPGAMVVAVIAVATVAFAQEPYRSSHSDVMARISYNSGFEPQDEVRQLCIAVTHDGEYRMVELLNDGNTRRQRGTVAKKEFRQLAKLLSAPNFRELSNNQAGLIRQDAESFSIEIPLGERSNNDGAREWIEHEAWRLQWLNPNGERPFPAPVSRIVDWLQHFQPKDGESFEYAESSEVCPVQGFRLLQPSVAENH